MKKLLPLHAGLPALCAVAAFAKDSTCDDPASLAAEIARMRPERQVWKGSLGRTCPNRRAGHRELCER
ncbi:MAG: hypothetical protein HYZ53_26580 [Planctomycetes bacterium]|nr:hypothetical protein [Planctomycetota bacterium]